MNKRKPILHIIALDPKTEIHVRKVFDEWKKEHPKFLEGYTVIINYKGEVDIKLLEKENKKYEYKLLNKMAYLGWSHELEKLNNLGKEGWKVVVIENSTLILMRELNV